MDILQNLKGIKIGDKLVVRPDISAVTQCRSGKTLEMDDFAGQTVTVCGFTSSGYSVRLEEDPTRLAWSYDLFCSDVFHSEPISLLDYLVGDR